jgi:hypothetical protein
MLQPSHCSIQAARAVLLILAVAAGGGALAPDGPGSVVVPPTATTHVPADVQKRVIDVFTPSLVLPDTTEWLFDYELPFEDGGQVICGRVNIQDSTRQYIGWRDFYVVVRGTDLSYSGMQPRSSVHDPTGSITHAFNVLCQRHDKAPD